jgi:outer membrane protein assembly factor BamD (BamD/ComL family)
MQVISIPKIALAVLAAFVMASCTEDQTSAGTGFEKQYFSARQALEKGNYTQARRGYGKLLVNAGALAPRLELEFAHLELRTGNYVQAAQLAKGLAQGHTGDARGAALAVQGTAQHEQALVVLQKGDVNGAKALLQEAQKALAEVVKTHPDLDPLGAMAGRRATIEARLKRL